MLLEIFPSLNRTSGFNEPLSTKATRVFLARLPWFGAGNAEVALKVMKPLHVNIGTVPSGYSKKGIAYLHKYLESVFLALLSVSTPKFSTLLPPGTCRRSNARTALPQPAASSNASNFSMLLGYAFPLCVCVCDAFHQFQGKNLKKTGRFISSLYLAKSFSLTEQFQCTDPFKSQCDSFVTWTQWFHFNIAVSALKELRAKGTPSDAVFPGTGIAFDHRNRRFFSFRRWESDFGTFWNHTHLYVIGHETLVNMEQEKESDQTPLRLLTSKGYLIFHKFQVMDTTSSTPNPVAVDFLVYIHLFLLHPSQDERHSTRGKDATSLLEVNQPACLR